VIFLLPTVKIYGIVEFQIRVINIFLERRMKMHLQAHVDGDLLKEVKKIAIDQDVHVKDYVQKALRTQLELDKAEAGTKESTNQTNKT
jgi:hypothetical protein